MSVVRPLQTVLLLLMVLALPGPVTAAPQPLTDGWEYRWGDSPLAPDGVPEWTRAEAPGDWQVIGFPSNPPNREGREQVWFRVPLPAGDWQDPVLYIYSVDIIVQVYLDGQQIYQYGSFDADGRGVFEGWPWHAIPLPEGYQNQPLYFRVFSDYTDIGLWGEVALMSQSELVLYILENSLEALVIGGVALLFALLALVFAPLQGDHKTLASLALFALAAAIMLVAESQASLLILYQPLLWDYLAAGSYYMLPVALALMLAQWLSDHRPRLITLIWQCHLLYLVVALGLALTGLVALSSTFPVFDALLLVSLVGMTLVLAQRYGDLSDEQQLLVIAFGLFAGLLIADMAVAHGYLPWSRVPVSWGILAFLLAVVVISLKHYARTQRALKQLTVSLERQVAERTARAEALARREQARVRMLTFENEKNRVLGDIITGLQDCLSLAQAFGLLVQNLPDLCSPLRGALYRRRSGNLFDRLTLWGVEGERSSLPPRLDERTGVPLPSSLPSAAGLTDGESFDRAVTGNLCFWMNIESVDEGVVTEAVLLLERDGLFASDESGYGMARLFTALDQAIQRIGITLSSIALREELQKFSYEDALTGLKNRRYFDQLFEHQCAVAVRSQMPLSLLVVDIDHFKDFNDTHGHEAGDCALRAIAGVLHRQFRESDIVCRYGGEEFVVILPGAHTVDARERAETLCRVAAKTPLLFEDKALAPVTVSVGAASWPESCTSPDQLLTLADQALYRAKHDGRNRVWIHGGQAA